MNYDTTKDWILQGDVLLRPVTDDIPGKLIRSGVIAEGEVTGHAHRIACLDDAQLIDIGEGQLMLKVGPKGVSIVHEEHSKVNVPPGNFEIVIDREYDYIADMERQVQD